MHKYYKSFISIFFVFILFVNLFSPLTVFAADDDSDFPIYDSDNWNLYDNTDITNVIVDQLLNRGIHEGDADYYENFIRYATEYISFGLGEVGAIINPDPYAFDQNAERLYQDLKNITDNGKIEVDKSTKRIKINKSFTDSALSYVKNKTKESDNGGYELLKTVPASKISKLYYNSPTATQSMYNLLKDNNGIIGLGYVGGRPTFYQIPQGVFYVKRSEKYNYGGTLIKHTAAAVMKDLTGGTTWLTARGASDSDTHVITGWKDEKLTYQSNGYDKYWFALYDCFSQFVDLKKGLNPMSTGSYAYLVTNSGVSIPVFNTVDDAVAYSVANNLYYTSSNYTGDGKEITITFEQANNITNGYYDDMYKLLLQMIDQKGGDALTPEQLQLLVDEIQSSFGLLKDEINKGFQQQDILIQKNSSILQNIADALNSFFAETKRFRESMDKMMRDFINGQKYTPPNTEPSTEPSTEPGTVPGTGTGDGTDDTGDGGLLKKLYDTVKDGFSDAVKELKKIKRWSALDTIIDGAGLVTDIVSLITDLLDPAKAADAVAEFVAEGADALTGVKDLMTDRFPFCIPADILILMQVLAHEPEAPHFEVPIVLESWGIDEKLVIDFSDFEYVSKICRTFLTIAWCFSLMNMTTKITNMKSI